MLARATGLSGIRYLLRKRAQRIDQGAHHNDLGTSWMVMRRVSLALQGASGSGGESYRGGGRRRHVGAPRPCGGPPPPTLPHPGPPPPPRPPAATRPTPAPPATPP